jgi:hypothetical protein
MNASDAGREGCGSTVGTLRSKSSWPTTSAFVAAVEMDDVEHGFGFMLFVEESRIDMLELFTFTGSWGGEDRAWRLVNRGPAEQAHA